MFLIIGDNNRMRPTVRKVARFLYFHPGIFVNDPAYQLGTLYHAPEMGDVIWEVKRALAKGISPIKCEHGTGKTYLLRDEEERPIAIFKLEGYQKEYAAYRLDHKHFAGVPPTVLSTLSHPIFGEEVIGSCQLFVEDTLPVVECCQKTYSELEPSSIRRIAQFDIRVINEDRHTSNILIRNKREVVPIDHGYCLSNELGDVHFGWSGWLQAATPFSEEEQGYISYLDPERDRALLSEELGFQEKIGNRLYLSTMVLKLGAIRNFYPSQIGDLYTKRGGSDSKFEILINRLLGRNARDWTTFAKYVNEEINTILAEYETNQQAHFKILN